MWIQKQIFYDQVTRVHFLERRMAAVEKRIAENDKRETEKVLHAMEGKTLEPAIQKTDATGEPPTEVDFRIDYKDEAIYGVELNIRTPGGGSGTGVDI